MISQSASHLIILVIRWLARVWGLALLALAILMVVNPDPNLRADIQWVEYLIPLFLVGGAVVGSLLAWRWERLGGALVIGGWLCSLLVDHFIYDRWLPIQVVVLTGLFFAMPGFLFLLCWYLSKGQSNHGAIEE